MVVVKWSACLPSNPLMLPRIPLKPKTFFCENIIDKNGSIQTEAGVGPLKQTFSATCRRHLQNAQFINYLDNRSYRRLFIFLQQNLHY